MRIHIFTATHTDHPGHLSHVEAGTDRVGALRRLADRFNFEPDIEEDVAAKLRIEAALDAGDALGAYAALREYLAGWYYLGYAERDVA